jgi:hypothetical protein
MILVARRKIKHRASAEFTCLTHIHWMGTIFVTYCDG